MKAVILTLIFICILIPFSALAQDEANDPCDPGAFAAALEAFATEVREADDPGAVLDEAAAWLAAQRGVCERASEATGDALTLTYTSEEEGLNPLIGPVTIPVGFYRVTFTGNSRFRIDIDPIQGSCYPGNIEILSYYIASAEAAAEGAEFYITSEECSAMLTIGDTSEAWTLEFIELTEADVTVVADEYGSEEYSRNSAIGPISIPAGLYRVTLTTPNRLSIRFDILEGDCGNQAFISESVGTGEAIDGAEILVQSEGCVGMLVVWGNEEWSIEWERLQ